MSIFAKNQRIMNFAGLLIGFGLGQGSLFAAQTWLLATGNIEFMGRFSFIFTMVILAFQAIDLGGLVILPRHVGAPDHKHNLPTFYWSFVTVRVISAVFLAICAGIWWMLDQTSFDSNYTAAAAVGLVAFSINPGGILDGHNKSGWTGATWALPFIASTVALPLSVNLPLQQAGIVLGAAMSAGAILAVAAQFIVLRSFKLEVRWCQPSLTAMREGAHEAALYMIGWLPGQVYFRGQIAIAMVLLGPSQAALFIYAKQLIMSATRFLYFARRVEYPNLVKQLADGQHLVYKVLTIQRISLSMGVVGMLAFAAFGVLLHIFVPENLQGAGLVIALFSPIILTASVNATFMQACYALKRTDVSAWLGVSIAVLGLGLQWLFVPHIGMAGIALAEGLCQLIGVLVTVLALSGKIGMGMRKASEQP